MFIFGKSNLFRIFLELLLRRRKLFAAKWKILRKYYRFASRFLSFISRYT